MSTSKMITLRSSEGEDFEVDVAVALQSPVITRMMEDGCAADENVIPLPEVKSKTLAKVVEYCKKRLESPKGDNYGKIEEELMTWDDEFIKAVDENTMVDIGVAAHHLKIWPLLNLTIVTDPPLMVEEIRKLFKNRAAEQIQIQNLPNRKAETYMGEYMTAPRYLPVDNSKAKPELKRSSWTWWERTSFLSKFSVVGASKKLLPVFLAVHVYYWMRMK